MNLKLVIEPRVFTIEQCNQFRSKPGPRYPVGTRVKTTTQFSAYMGEERGNQVHYGTVTGYNQRSCDEVSLKEFDVHETYQVQLDNGESLPIWPEEIEGA